METFETPSSLAEELAKRAAKFPKKTPAELEADRLRSEERARELTANTIRDQREAFIRRVGKRYAQCSIANFQIDEGNQKQADVLNRIREFGEKLEANHKAGRNVLLFGPPGTGKDHLMVSLMLQAIDKGANVEWVNGMDFFGTIRDRMEDAAESEILKKLTAPHILAISDPLPPWGPLTPFQAQMLFRVIDRRYRDMKPIWCTMNVASGKEAEDRLGSAVVDRLRENALTLHCEWPSYRRRETT